MLTVTNATKAQITAALNAVLLVVRDFGIGHVTDRQWTGIGVAVNAVAALIVGVTYKSSKLRANPPA